MLAGRAIPGQSWADGIPAAASAAQCPSHMITSPLILQRRAGSWPQEGELRGASPSEPSQLCTLIFSELEIYITPLFSASQASASETSERGTAVVCQFKLQASHKRHLQAAVLKGVSGKSFPHVCRLQTEEGESVGPYRVWLGDVWLPGLAMSRAMGDTMARR